MCIRDGLNERFVVEREHLFTQSRLKPPKSSPNTTIHRARMNVLPLVRICPHVFSVYIHVESVFICVWFSFPETAVTHCWWYAIQSTSHTSYSHNRVLHLLCIAASVLVNTCWIKTAAPGVCWGLLIALHGTEIQAVNCEEISFYSMLSQYVCWERSSTNIPEHGLITWCTL